MKLKVLVPLAVALGATVIPLTAALSASGRGSVPQVNVDAQRQLEAGSILSFPAPQKAPWEVQSPRTVSPRHWDVAFQAGDGGRLSLDPHYSWFDPSAFGRSSANYAFHLGDRTP